MILKVQTLQQLASRFAASPCLLTWSLPCCLLLGKLFSLARSRLLFASIVLSQPSLPACSAISQSARRQVARTHTGLMAPEPGLSFVLLISIACQVVHGFHLYVPEEDDWNGRRLLSVFPPYGGNVELGGCEVDESLWRGVQGYQSTPAFCVCDGDTSCDKTSVDLCDPDYRPTLSCDEAAKDSCDGTCGSMCSCDTMASCDIDSSLTITGEITSRTQRPCEHAESKFPPDTFEHTSHHWDE